MTHFFTPEEANKKLPDVRKVVERIVELKRLIDVENDEKGRARAANQIASLISTLEESGVQLKDMDTGLLDFPATRYGEPVLLCWKLGEEEVLYWHNATEGYRGRKPLRPELTKIR